VSQWAMTGLRHEMPGLLQSWER